MRFFVGFLLIAIVIVRSNMVQANPSAHPMVPDGLELVHVQIVDNMPWASGLSQKWNLADKQQSVFHFARFIKSGLVKGSEAAARSSRYGIFYQSANATSVHDGKWVIRPNWSGLFPVNSDFALVRKPETDDWYVFDVVKGKSKKLGTGEIGIIDVLHEYSLSKKPWMGAQRYYLSNNDNGKTQTIRPIYWDDKNREILAWQAIPNVISRSNSNVTIPVQLTIERDYLIRRLNPSGLVTEGALSHFALTNKFRKNDILIREGNEYQGPYVHTYPEKNLLKVLDSDDQLYLPIMGSFSYKSFVFKQGEETEYRLLGLRPIGRQVSVELKDDPLEQYRNSGYAVVWDTPSGRRLAPVFGELDSACMGKCERHYLGYMNADYISRTKEQAVYVGLERIEIPKHLTKDAALGRMFAAATRAFYPDGRVDIFIRMPYDRRYQGTVLLATEQPLESRQAALALEKQILSVAGRDEFVRRVISRQWLANYKKRQQAEARRLALLTPEQRKQLEWSKQRTKRILELKQATKSQIDAFLARRDWFGAQAAALDGYSGLLEYAVSGVIAAGGEGSVSNENIRRSMGLVDEKSPRHSMLRNLLVERLPPQVRAAPSRNWGSISTNEQAVRRRYLGRSATASNRNTLSTAQEKSRSSYNRGATSQYLCGASSFCD